MSTIITSIASWALFTFAISCLLQFAYYTISFNGINKKTKGIFDDIVVDKDPLSKSEIEEKINKINLVIDYRGRSRFFGTLSIFIMVCVFLITPNKHPLSNDVFLLFFLVSSGILFLFLKFFENIGGILFEKEKKLSFVEYGLIPRCKIDSIMSIGASKEYLKKVALSDRSITMYEIDILEKFAQDSRDKEYDASILKLITGE